MEMICNCNYGWVCVRVCDNIFSSSGACGFCVSYDMDLRKLLTPLSHKDLVPHLNPSNSLPLPTKMITLPKYMCCLPINETSCYCECDIHVRSGALAPVFFTILKNYILNSCKPLRCNFYNNYIPRPWLERKLEGNRFNNFM